MQTRDIVPALPVLHRCMHVVFCCGALGCVIRENVAPGKKFVLLISAILLQIPVATETNFENPSRLRKKNMMDDGEQGLRIRGLPPGERRLERITNRGRRYPMRPQLEPGARH